MFASPDSGNSAPGLCHFPFSRAYGTHERTPWDPAFTSARGHPEGAKSWVGSPFPGAMFAEGAGEDPQAITSFGQTTRTSQTRYLVVTAPRAWARHVGRNCTTDSWKTGFGEGWGKSPLSTLVLTTTYLTLPETIPGLGHTKAGYPRERETDPSTGPRSHRF